MQHSTSRKQKANTRNGATCTDKIRSQWQQAKQKRFKPLLPLKEVLEHEHAGAYQQATAGAGAGAGGGAGVSQAGEKKK